MSIQPYSRAMVTKGPNFGKLVTVLERADFSDQPNGAVDCACDLIDEDIWITKSLGSPFKLGDVLTNLAYFPTSHLTLFLDEDEIFDEFIYEEVPIEKPKIKIADNLIDIINKVKKN